MKLKWNWGTGVVLAFIAFMSFILYFVFQLYTDSKLSYEMSTPDYYKEELQYQTKMESIERANRLKTPLQIDTKTENIIIDFPSNMDYHRISGQMVFYRPSDKLLDLSINIKLDSYRVSIPKTLFRKGKWELTINWTHNDLDYTNIYKLNL